MLNKRVFITGLEGFTGKYLTAELQSAGYEIFGTIKLGNESSNKFICNLLDTEKLAHYIQKTQPQFVVNLAGISFVDHNSSVDIYQVNQLGTLSLLEAISKSKHIPEKILLTSSAHVYGDQDATIISEDCMLKPKSDYAVSKFAMEALAELWFERLPITIVRPFNYTGVGQSPLFLPSKIVSHFKKKASYIELGNLNVARDWSDVRDVVASYRYLLESTKASVIVNVCSGKTYSLQYILDELTEISSHKLSIRVNPDLVRQNEIKELGGDNRLLASMIPQLQIRALRTTLAWMYESES